MTIPTNCCCARSARATLLPPPRPCGPLRNHRAPSILTARSRRSRAAPDMSLAWIPYANGRSQLSPRAARPFAGILPVVGIPAILLATLVLTLLGGAEVASAHPANVAAPSASMVVVSESPASSLPPQFTPTVQYWARDIERWAASYHLPVNWIAVVMQIESCGHPSIRSPRRRRRTLPGDALPLCLRRRLAGCGNERRPRAHLPGPRLQPGLRRSQLGAGRLQRRPRNDRPAP